jgi:hypothetical protein
MADLDALDDGDFVGLHEESIFWIRVGVYSQPLRNQCSL